MIVRIRLADQNTTLVIIHSHLAIAPVISRDPVHVDPLSAVHHSQAAVTLGPITNPFILGAAQTLLPLFPRVILVHARHEGLKRYLWYNPARAFAPKRK